MGLWVIGTVPWGEGLVPKQCEGSMGYRAGPMRWSHGIQGWSLRGGEMR